MGSVAESRRHSVCSLATLKHYTVLGTAHAAETAGMVMSVDPFDHSVSDQPVLQISPSWLAYCLSAVPCRIITGLLLCKCSVLQIVWASC